MKRGLTCVLLLALFTVSCAALNNSPRAMNSCLQELEIYDKLFEGKINVFFKDDVTWDEAITILNSYGLEKAIGQTPHTDPLEQKAKRKDINDLPPEQQQFIKIMDQAQKGAANMTPEQKVAMQQLKDVWKQRGIDPENPSDEMKARLKEMEASIEEANRQEFTKTKTMTVAVPVGQEKSIACTLKDKSIVRVLPVQQLEMIDIFSQSNL